MPAAFFASNSLFMIFSIFSFNFTTKVFFFYKSEAMRKIPLFRFEAKNISLPFCIFSFL
jgi:hypothetical protein